MPRPILTEGTPMASISINVNQNQVTVSCDAYDWTSLSVGGQPAATSFPASQTASGQQPIQFQANYSGGSPAVPQAPMVLTSQDPGTGDCWVAQVNFSSDSNGGCNVTGTVNYLPQCQAGPAGGTPLLFSANGLSGSFSQS
jgi:hypothetical protein